MAIVRSGVVVWLFVLVAIHPPANCTAQTTAPSLQDTAALSEAAKKFEAHAKAVAAAYEIRTDSAAGRKLMLRAEPVLNWTNPVPEKQMHGDVFLWTDDGRPAVVLCLFEMTESGDVHEFHEFCSLAPAGLVTTSSDTRPWSPATSQLTMSPLPDAPSPATTPRQRLMQMRELAGRFACEKTTRMGDVRSLRLLSQPLARYESKTHKVAEGALFAFVEATDPELFLLLELRSAGDTSQWQFGFTRMASVKMRVSLADKFVWQVDTIPYDDYRNRLDLPYALLLAR